MPVSGTEKGYIVFVMQARGDMETTLLSIRPETAEATEEVREKFSHVKAAWQSAQSSGFQLRWQGDTEGSAE
jgi:hypothetical protein